MKKTFAFISILTFCMLSAPAQQPVAKIAGGQLAGTNEDGVYRYAGIPYAAPPVGPLRWKDPQSPKSWTGKRDATKFGPQAPQRAVYKDMVTRSPEASEDCLYLNVWTPESSTGKTLPVLVYFHGGGLSSGDGSEMRYDGASVASKGVVVVTVNYRLGIFGFFVHPDLAKESNTHTSGNYGFKDQVMALKWVNKNIQAFGGDPAKVTIAGQSAGSISVSALMASPLAKGLFRSAIGQSGSMLGAMMPVGRKDAEANGVQFQEQLGVKSLRELRALSTKELHEASPRARNWFGPVVDGDFLKDSPMDLYAVGLQADIPLLAGWTSAEVGYQQVFGKGTLDTALYFSKIRELYGNKAADVIKYYPADSMQQMIRSATDLASDRFIAYSTWKWMDLHAKTSGSNVYRYIFSKKVPGSTMIGAAHSSDIDYALGNLPLNDMFNWTAEDKAVSATMQAFFVNFIKTGDPNGAGLPVWPTLQASIPKVMVFDTNVQAEGEKNLKRYVFMDQFYYR